MKLVKKCLIAFNNQCTNKITKKEVDNDVDFRFTLLDMQKFAKYYHKQKLTLNDVSQQRELLELVTEIANSNQVCSNTRHKLWAKKLIGSNCG